MNRITPAMARAVLIGARDRAKKMGRDKQVMRLRIGCVYRKLYPLLMT